MYHKLVFVFITIIQYFISPAENFSGLPNPGSAKAEQFKLLLNSGEFSLSVSAFTENKGQVRGHDDKSVPEVKYSFQQGPLQLFLLEGGIAYQLTHLHYPEGYHELIEMKIKNSATQQRILELRKQIRVETFRMDMTLIGANTHALITSEEKSNEYSNYYNHNALDVHSYNKIIYHQIYPGIDWVLYVRNNQLKYDFIVHPDADPSMIQMEYSHQEELKLNEDGSFDLKNKLGSISEIAPISFQGTKSIGTRFVQKGDRISFLLDKFNPKQTLVIDPTLVWSSYYGNTGNEFGYSCTTDAWGNVYLAGTTDSFSGIASGGHQNTIAASNDAFLVKFNAFGQRLWGTYYGGNGVDAAFSCVTDYTGHVYLAGTTQSTNGIASGGHQNLMAGSNEAFLVKFNGSGLRQWGTYYGGYAADGGHSCVTDHLGKVYLGGVTSSSTGIASGGHENTYLGGTSAAFLVKFNGFGTRLWGSYYGGTNEEVGYTVATDAFANVFLAGNTTSSIGIAAGGHQNTFGGGFNDAFLVKFNTSGVRQWGTFYGGNGWEFGYSCATDPDGNIYLTGATQSSTGIAGSGHQNFFGGGMYDAFLTKFNSLGLRQWGTYYGGDGDDYGRSCAIDVFGNVYLAGETTSTAGIASGGFQNILTGSYDAFLTAFNPGGLRQWGSYYGGPNFEFGSLCATDVFGHVYLPGQTTSTSGITSGGYQTNFGGGFTDAFLIKVCSTPPPQPLTINGNTIVCSGSAQIYSTSGALSSNSYSWLLPGGWSGSSTTSSISSVAGNSGIITVVQQNACGVSMAQTLNIVVDACLGIDQKGEQNETTVFFPNPSRGTIFVEASQELRIRVYGSFGQFLFQQKITELNNSIDLNQRANGIYFLEIIQNEKTDRIKIVKY